MSHFLFEEEQRFTRLAWLWILSTLAVLAPIGIIMGTNPQAFSSPMLALTLLSMGIPFVILMWFCRLEVRVDEAGLRYRFRPTVFQWKIIPPSQIISYEIRDAKNWHERFSVGFSRSWLRNTTFMNITGKKFLVVTLSDNSTLMIGIENAESMAWAMKRLTSK